MVREELVAVDSIEVDIGQRIFNEEMDTGKINGEGI